MTEVTVLPAARVGRWWVRGLTFPTLGYKPVNDPQARSGSGGRVLIDIDQVKANGQNTHPDAAFALAAWISAINVLTANTTPQVTVSVLGQR